MTMASVMPLSLPFRRCRFLQGPHLRSEQGYVILLCLPPKNLQGAPLWSCSLKTQICPKPNLLVAYEERRPLTQLMVSIRGQCQDFDIFYPGLICLQGRSLVFLQHHWPPCNLNMDILAACWCQTQVPQGWFPGAQSRQDEMGLAGRRSPRVCWE